MCVVKSSTKTSLVVKTSSKASHSTERVHWTMGAMVCVCVCVCVYALCVVRVCVCVCGVCVCVCE